MMIEPPYFLKNKEWYVETKGVPKFLGGKAKRKYKLTSKAPQKAIDSYNNYYKEIDAK